MSKKQVELRPGVMHGSEQLYVVTKLTNSTAPRIGSEVSESEVKELIRRPGWTVVIKGRSD